MLLDNVSNFFNFELPSVLTELLNSRQFMFITKQSYYIAILISCCDCMCVCVLFSFFCSFVLLS